MVSSSLFGETESQGESVAACLGGHVDIVSQNPGDVAREAVKAGGAVSQCIYTWPAFTRRTGEEEGKYPSGKDSEMRPG